MGEQSGQRPQIREATISSRLSQRSVSALGLELAVAMVMTVLVVGACGSGSQTPTEQFDSLTNCDFPEITISFLHVPPTPNEVKAKIVNEFGPDKIIGTIVAVDADHGIYKFGAMPAATLTDLEGAIVRSIGQPYRFVAQCDPSN